MVLTEPYEAAVVADHNSTDWARPKRISLPSMLRERGRRCRRAGSGLPKRSAPQARRQPDDEQHRHRRPRSRRPGAGRRPGGRRRTERRPESRGSTRSAGSCDSPVGFSNGCAELALKKPPPLVPSCLMATCEADRAERDGLAGRPPAWSRSTDASSVCGMPWLTRNSARARQTAAGRREWRGSDRPRNCRWSRPDRVATARVTATRHRDAGGGGHEVLDRQAEHLATGATAWSRRHRPASWCW